MLAREALYYFADQYLIIDYKSVNTLFHNLPLPPNNNALSLDSDDNTNVTYTNIFIKEESYYDPNPTLRAPLMHTVSPNCNTSISLELDLDLLSLDPSKSDLRLFL